MVAVSEIEFDAVAEQLRDPVGLSPLEGAPTASALFGPLNPPELIGTSSKPIGVTEQVLFTRDRSAAYPVVEGIPVLMATERLSAEPSSVQVANTHFEEAYLEQELYSELAENVLGASGGRWATVDVWKSAFHKVGTRVFGKCNGNPHCRPISEQRLAPVSSLVCVRGTAPAEVVHQLSR